MPVKRREPKQRIAGLRDAARAFFLDQDCPEGCGPWEWWLLRNEHDSTLALWQEHREEILEEFIQQHPGRRPRAWWTFGDAPEERRRRLAGRGTAREDLGGWNDTSTCGIPDSWCDAHAAGLAIDPLDPPQFESEAAYLKRHGLFLRGEEKRLRPEDFDPEVLNRKEVSYGNG